VNKEYKDLINLYIRAKDHHQPHLMGLAFAPDAVLTMEVNTDAIDFPSNIVGLKGITDILINEFHVQYQNVCTFCVSDTVNTRDNELQCQWLVGMTDTKSGAPRIGYGTYHWKFTSQNIGKETLVRQLRINIANMVVLPENSTAVVLPWLGALPHPWVMYSDIASSAPDLPIINEFLSSTN